MPRSGSTLRPLPEASALSLRAYRLDRDLTYRELSALIGVSVHVTFKAIHGHSLNERSAYKIERFLEVVHAAA